MFRGKIILIIIYLFIKQLLVVLKFELNIIIFKLINLNLQSKSHNKGSCEDQCFIDIKGIIKSTESTQGMLKLKKNCNI